VARYYFLYEHLSGALNDGTIHAGGALPSEPDLATRYKLSRTTVRRALARLEEEGRIVRHQGRGTYARQSYKPPALHLNLQDFFKELPALASRTASSVLRFEIGPTPPALRELQPQLAPHALIVQRLHRFRGTPFALSTAYVPERIGERVPREAFDQSSLLTVLDQLGRRTTKTEYTTTAVAADVVAAKRLNVQLGAPLLRNRAVLFSAGGVQAVVDSVCRPDRFNIRAALERSPLRNSRSQWRLKRS